MRRLILLTSLALANADLNILPVDPLVDPAAITIGGFASAEDLQECWNRLSVSDANRDLKVFPNEYVTFAKLMSPPGLLEGITEFRDLPLPFKAAFQFNACLCRQPSFGGNATDLECCFGANAHLRVPASPDDDPSPEDAAYLVATCSYTASAAEAVVATDRPTRAPVGTGTEEPTIDGTAEPTTAGTAEPTVDGTAEPTVDGAAEPTVEPSDSGTGTPTITGAPSGEASAEPTVGATANPTVSPTVEPTLEPTNEPTSVPTVQPTKAETAEPTLEPTTEPTAAATSALPSAEALTVYQILVEGGVSMANDSSFEESYLLDIQRAMNILAPKVAFETFGSGRRLFVRVRRRLAVSVQLPTVISGIENIDCPADADATADNLCRNLTSTITLLLEDEEGSPSDIVAEYEGAMGVAISEGRLQDEIRQSNPESPVFVVGPAPVPTPAPAPAGSGLSTGATAGIVIGVLVVVTLIISLIFYMRRDRSKPPVPVGGPTPDETQGIIQKIDYEPFEREPRIPKGGPPIPPPEEPVPAAEVKKIPKIDYEPFDQPPIGTMKPDMELDPMYLKTPSEMDSESDIYTDGTMYSVPPAEQMMEGVKPKQVAKVAAVAAAGDDAMAESDAGSSGWSSSAGLSSLNTGSMDDSSDPAVIAGAVVAGTVGVAAIGAVAAAGSKDKDKDSALGAPLDDTQATRSQLDSLIEAGDWAAVGATAALLAAASDSESKTDRSATATAKSYESASVDAARAAELEALVDAGDWEGVVLAAARYEAQESSSGGGTSSDGASLTVGSAAATSVESDAEKKVRVRKEVEELVARVVPDELDNVDEMMKQFEGREEELVETLRTMEERSVAQKAREAGQVAAKAEARETVLAGKKSDPSSPGGEPAPGMVPASPESQTSTVTPPRQKTALEIAIEEGDWAAVGEAAAMMSESGSVTSATTGDLERLSEAVADVGTTSKSSGESQGEDRAKSLEAMIDKGDWTGVVSATKKFDEADKKGRTKEEEEALKQAEEWMKIAEQKKAEGATDEGASEAAEWAIQRSLDQMKQADAESKKQEKTEDEDEV